MSNNLRTRNGMPFNFVNGLKVRGMDIESLIPGIEGIPEAGSKYQFAGDGSNKVFTLPVSPYNKDAVDVYVKQLYVHPDDYTLVGDVVTLTEAPPALDAGETYNVLIKVNLTTLNGYVNANRVSFEGENLDDILEKGKPLANYSNLRSYAGAATQVRITDPDIAGFFYYDASDTSSADNGGTIIVASNNKRWKRVFDGAVNVFWFMSAAQIANVQVGALTVDVTAALQAFTNACQNRRGHIPAGKYKITSALVLDPQYSYIIEGDGWDPNANTGTAIWNYGTGNAIQIHGAGGHDQQIRLADMAIAGNASSQCGVSVIQTLVFFENLWITSHGFHGLRLEKAYGSAFKQCTVTQNYQHGVFVYKQGNAILFDHCVINGNSRTNGYTNCTLTGVANEENLGLTFVGCDFTSAGYPAGVTTAYGLVIQHSRAVNLIGCYMEQNKLRNVYADTSVKGLAITGNYFQDGINEISGVDGLIYENNFHQQVYATTRADIASSTGARLSFRLHGNTYTGGASSNYTGGTKERAEIYNTAAPSSGTWQHGDIVWHSLPYSGGNLGWVCTTAGTPGTWKSFGTIAV